MCTSFSHEWTEAGKELNFTCKHGGFTHTISEHAKDYSLSPVNRGDKCLCLMMCEMMVMMYQLHDEAASQMEENTELRDEVKKLKTDLAAWMPF